jgi:uncharacterized repeat protein (TIGR01451 family)
MSKRVPSKLVADVTNSVCRMVLLVIFASFALVPAAQAAKRRKRTPTPTPTPTRSATRTPTPLPTPPTTDLEVTVTHGAMTAIAGATHTYTVVVRNLGPANVSGAAVTDMFPTDFIAVTFTTTQTGGASGFTASGADNIDDTVTMPAGSSITYKATGKVASVATGNVSNMAIVTAPSGVMDPNPADNSATDTETINLQADLKVTVTDAKTKIPAGRKNTYTIVATNLGPSDVSAATVTDSFPAGFKNVTYTASQSGGATGFTPSGRDNINDTVTMPSGSKITYKAKGITSRSATGSISETATVSVPNGATDPNLSNNSATDTDTIQ